MKNTWGFVFFILKIITALVSPFFRVEDWSKKVSSLPGVKHRQSELSKQSHYAWYAET